MKTHLKLLIMTLSMSAFMNCKKADCEPVSAPNAASSHADTTASELAAEGTEEKTEAVGGTTSGSQRKYLRRKTHQKRLTQYQIDSIKTERGAIVTPAQNVGASLTPGSGKAVPSNTKVGPGTTASMGSSIGN